MRTKNSVKLYKPKSLIDGGQIGMTPGSSWVAVPDKFGDKPFTVLYNGLQMDIKSWRKEAKLFKRFRDQYWHEGSNRSQFYTLGYFKWENVKF